jgi:hypothetical protein
MMKLLLTNVDEMTLPLEPPMRLGLVAVGAIRNAFVLLTRTVNVMLSVVPMKLFTVAPLLPCSFQ